MVNLKEVSRKTGLTIRQLEIVTYLAQGFSTLETAKKLGIAAKTVEVHRYNLYFKLQIHKITDLVKFAISHKLTSEWKGN